MAKKNNRKCIVCGREYYYCSHNCMDSINKPSWYTIFHDENCHDIYGAVANILPQEGKEAAKEALDKCDLSNKENFHPNIIKSINEIYDIVEEVKEKKNEKIEERENKEIKVAASSTDFKKEIEEENKKEEKKIETEAEIKSEKSDTATAKKVQGRTRNKK